MKTPILSLVEWEDSAQPSPAWQWIEDVEPQATAIQCLTAGWIVSRTKAAIQIAQSIGDGKQACGIMTIPRRAILKITPLAR